jgi:hypothetical protein
MTGYGAIEAAANEKVPEDAAYRRPNQKKRGEFETWDHAKIVRYLSLDEKLKKVLPAVVGLESPVKLSAWDGFVNLEKLRNRLTHTKKEDVTTWQPGTPIPDTIWGRLLDPLMPDPSRIAKDFMVYLGGSTPPHSVKYAPF